MKPSNCLSLLGFSATLGLLAASLVGCNADVGRPPNMTGSTGGTSGPSGTGGGVVNPGSGGGVVNPGSGGSIVNPGTGGAVVVGPCMPGIPASSQIPRITRQQYDTVVRELLNVSVL